MNLQDRRVSLLNKCSDTLDLFKMNVFKDRDRKRCCNVVKYFITSDTPDGIRMVAKGMFMYQDWRDMREVEEDAEKLFNYMLANVVRWNRRWRESKRRTLCQELKMK